MMNDYNSYLCTKKKDKPVCPVLTNLINVMEEHCTLYAFHIKFKLLCFMLHKKISRSLAKIYGFVFAAMLELRYE